MSNAPDHHEGEGKAHKHKGGHGAHGGGHEEGHEGAPEWLISFADMVMLMMGFFVILFALNNKPSGREPGGHASDDAGSAAAQSNDHMLDLALSIREAFNNPVSIHSSDPRDAALVKRLLQRAGRSETRTPGVKGFENDVQSLRPSEYYALSGSVQFTDNSSEISAEARETIAEIAGKVRGLRLMIEVRGHVSSVEATRGPEVAMRLSMDRALAVAKALAAEGVSWRQVRLATCGDNDRIEAHPSNRSADRANARVEVILTDEVVPDEVPTRYGPQA